MRAMLVGAAVVGLAAAGGCGGSSPPDGPPTPPAVMALQEVGSMLQASAGRRGPALAADLAAFEQTMPTGYAAVKSGEVVVVCGAAIPGEGDAASAPDEVVAYEKKAPTDGGHVLLLNGTVKAMTAAEFAAAPKAAGR